MYATYTQGRQKGGGELDGSKEPGRKVVWCDKRRPKTLFLKFFFFIFFEFCHNLPLNNSNINSTIWKPKGKTLSYQTTLPHITSFTHMKRAQLSTLTLLPAQEIGPYLAMMLRTNLFYLKWRFGGATTVSRINDTC